MIGAEGDLHTRRDKRRQKVNATIQWQGKEDCSREGKERKGRDTNLRRGDVESFEEVWVRVRQLYDLYVRQ